MDALCPSCGFCQRLECGHAPLYERYNMTLACESEAQRLTEPRLCYEKRHRQASRLPRYLCGNVLREPASVTAISR